MLVGGGVDPPVLVALVMLAEQMTRLPPPLAELLHWLIVIGSAEDDATARADALVHRGGFRTGGNADEVVRDDNAAAECAAPALNRAIALVDGRDRRSHRKRRG